MCLHNIERSMCVYVYASISSYVFLLKFEVHRTISKRTTFLECPDISSPTWNHPCSPWCSPQPANKQKKIRVKYFCWQLIAPILSDLYLSTRSSSLGTIGCCETLAYFKYTPVKRKNNNYQYSFLYCQFAIWITLPC
jgi:hypothetical protein